MSRVRRAVCVAAALTSVVACSHEKNGGLTSDGPIHSQIASEHEGATIGVTSTTVEFWVYDLVLKNWSDQSVTLDRVQLGKAPGVVPPVLVRAAIIGFDRKFGGGPPGLIGGALHPLRGYRIPPQSTLAGPRQRGLAYLLELRLHAGDAQRSYTAAERGVQVYYHDDEGQHYVAYFNMQYVVCLSMSTCDSPYQS